MRLCRSSLGLETGICLLRKWKECKKQGWRKEWAKRVVRNAKDQHRSCGVENRIHASLAAGLVMKRDECYGMSLFRWTGEGDEGDVNGIDAVAWLLASANRVRTANIIALGFIKK